MQGTLARKFLILVAAVCLPIGGAHQAKAEDIIIGVGSSAPVHYHLGKALCRAIQKTHQGMTCGTLRIVGRHQAEPLAVLNDVRNGAMEVGIVTSDWVHHTYNGTGPVKFMGDKFVNLRSLFVLHSEPFTVIARRGAGITKFDDLAGKRVNIGIPGSNQRAVMEQVMEAKGWTRKSFQVADELTGPEQSLALCHDRIQAMVATVAHPDSTLAKTMSLCNARIVSVGGTGTSKLFAANPYYAPAVIPGGIYKGQSAAIQTFGVRVAVVASKEISEDDVYEVVKAVFKNLDSFKRLHPALEQMQAQDMIKNGLTLPLHPGAIRYFREMGMM